MNYNRSLRTRSRFRSGVTNYYKRAKLLVNYDKIIRLVFRKKSKFLIAGLHLTNDPAKSDYCLKSWDSRGFIVDQYLPRQENFPRYLSAQICKQYAFGLKSGLLINELVQSKNYAHRKLVLELGTQHRKRSYFFVRGLLSVLDSKIGFTYNYAPSALYLSMAQHLDSIHGYGQK